MSRSTKQVLQMDQLISSLAKLGPSELYETQRLTKDFTVTTCNAYSLTTNLSNYVV